jgi:putative ABC transport system ATP-binding protein
VVAAVLELKNTTKIYKQGSVTVTAVNEVSLELRNSEVLLIIGPSGSGKTTLLSLMGCILQPTHGDVIVNGRVVSALSEKKLPDIRKTHFGFVFQSFNLFPSLTAAQNVELALRMRSWRRRDLKPKALDLLNRVGLENRAGFYPRDLSGGEKQRVAFARALVSDPPILLADEPTANLDSNTGREILAMLKSVAETEGKAVCVVSHDPKAESMAHRTVTLEDGRIRS